MKRTNFKGESLKEWVLEEESEHFFLLKEVGGTKILNYPKSTFESENKYAGASREGDKFYIPEKRVK